ncbi:hypothetical protein FS837_008393 [Tulasnella sp. UAMH 9824]|nr:hypothetical protein FS837_008393 [Tulasnella sp. UAMH 9824]
MAIAWYLSDHIMGGYRFLMDNYNHGDKIWLFGFSRGAYTARCLAGMLNLLLIRQGADPHAKVGLLPRGNEEQISFAYALYKDKSKDGVIKAYGFKKAFSRHVFIEFMGVWDSVTSVGLAGRTLPYTSHNEIVKTFRQAFSLDERRSKFRHNPWAKAPPPGSAPTARLTPRNWFNARRQNSTGSGPSQQQQNQEQRTFGNRETDPRHYRADCDARDKEGWEYLSPNPSWANTDCREVWFAGSHSDVGGGQVNTSDDDHQNNLANPSLLWMVQQIDALGAGICWAPDAFEDIPTLRAYFDQKRESNRDTEPGLSETVIKELEKDVSGKIHDSLGRVTPWWVLEFVPVWKHFLDDNKVQWKEL